MKKRYFYFIFIFFSFCFLVGCSDMFYVDYKGYVINFKTKEPIPNAQFTFVDTAEDEEDSKEILVKTDSNGYFELSVSDLSFAPEPANYALDTSAEGYGILKSWSFWDTELIRIPLMPPNSIYGNFNDYDNSFEVEILLKGENFEKKTLCNENGDYYFLDVPRGKELTLYMYKREDFNTLYDFHEISADALEENYIIYRDISKENVYQ